MKTGLSAKHLIHILLIAIFAFAPLCLDAKASAKPNVIILLTDDQGYGDISAHGSPVLKTPETDKLRSESVRLTDFHVAPMCTPTRGQLLTGMDAMRTLADDDRIGIPIMSHPAFIGTFVTGAEQGISHYALYGQIMRLAGADASIFPNYGGRFSFSQDACREIAAGSKVLMGEIKTSFPAPGGGMSLGRIDEMIEFYGQDVILLIGGDLHRGEDGLVENTRRFREKVEGKN